jgi:hypothetical protein
MGSEFGEGIFSQIAIAEPRKALIGLLVGF